MQRTTLLIWQERLKRMLKPASAVMIGGSNLVPAIAYTRDMGYKGRLYVINPYHDEIAGIPCLNSVDELPEVPELAFVSVPKESVADTVAAVSQYGVLSAVCNSAGFSELKDDGIDRQSQLVTAAGGMPTLGPNCPGFANFVDNSVFMQDHFGDHGHVSEGVAVISNGGAYLSDLTCARRSLSIAYAIGVGNQAMLSIGAMLDAVLDDTRVKAANLYIESFHDVPALSRAALKAARNNIPVVVVKGGQTAAGERAAQTHTASIAGASAVASALFKRFGFIEAVNPVQAIETLKMLTCTSRPSAARAAFVTSSGSYAVLGGDAAQRAGLDIPPLQELAAESIKQQIPHFVLPGNPLDISETQFEADQVQLNLFQTFLSGDRYDLAMLVMSFPPPGGWLPESWYRTANNFAGVCQQLNLPCAFVNTVPEDLPVDARVQMLKQNMAPLMGIDHGMQAIGDAVNASIIQNRLAQTPDQQILLESIERINGPVRSIDEYTAKQRLAAHGVAVPNSQVINISGGVPDELQYPIALKALSAGLTHKTEVGAVELNIASEQVLQQAVVSMRRRMKSKAPDHEISQYLIEEMIVDGVAELMVGIRFVENIGLTLTLAVGGVAVELLNDAVTIMLPASRREIFKALVSLRLYPLFTGWRGRARADVEAALDSIESMIAFATANQEALEALEVNPLILRERGKGAYCVDAVLNIRC